MYWIENLILDGAMITLTLFLMGKQIRIRRIMISAFLGASASTMILVCGLHFGWLYVLLLFAVGMAMMYLAMEQKSGNDLFLGLIYDTTLTFVFSELMKGGALLTGNRGGARAAAGMILAGMSAVLCYVRYRSRKSRQNTIYQVSITQQGRRMDVKALFDTGNALTEPISGKPVSIVESSAWQTVMEEPKPQHVKVIPFHSIGGEHGLLKGMEVEEIAIWTGEKKIVLKQAVIALYEGSLSEDRSFQMILHQGLLNLERYGY